MYFKLKLQKFDMCSCHSNFDYYTYKHFTHPSILGSEFLEATNFVYTQSMTSGISYPRIQITFF